MAQKPEPLLHSLSCTGDGSNISEGDVESKSNEAYGWKGLLADLQSGLAVTCVSIPSAIAYAELAGVPALNGLTRAGPPLIIFGLLTGVPWLASGTTSLTAVATATDLGADTYKAAHGEDAYVLLVSLYTILIAAASIAYGLLGLGGVAKMIPRPVTAGFKWGAAITILAAQSPMCFFLRGRGQLAQLMAETSFVGDLQRSIPSLLSGAKGICRLAYIVSHPAAWNLASMVFAISAMGIILRGKRLGIPGGTEVLFATAVATGLSLYLGYEDYGGSVVGEIPAAATKLIPDIYWSSLPWEESPRLIIPALIFAAVNFSATVAICGAFEVDYGIKWEPNREFLVSGAANVVAGVVGCPPFGGSLTRSLLTKLTGGRSSVAAVVNGLSMMMLLPYLGVISATPKAVLAAVVLASVCKEIVYPKSLLALKGSDRLLGWATAVVTSCSSPTIGIIFGSALAVILPRDPVPSGDKNK